MPLNKRFSLVVNFFIIIFVLLVSRIFYIQFFQGEKLDSDASAQRISAATIEKPRGSIVDRNFIPFTNRAVESSLVLEPLLLRGKNEYIQKLSGALGINVEKLKGEIACKKVPIIMEIQPEKIDEAHSLKGRGVSVLNKLKRYGEYSLLAHVLGYLNKTDHVGAAGLEKFYDNDLKASNENSIRIVTNANDKILQGIGCRIKRAGTDGGMLGVKLTVDYHIQKITEDIMAKYSMNGAVVVEDVNTGDIVAMASSPEFNQNDVGRYLKSPLNELFNRAVASYNIGSVFKVVSAAAALESNISLGDDYICNGIIKLGDREFRCSSYDRGGHGKIGFSEAFANSCNTYFIDLGIKVGSKRLITMAEKFGFGKVTGIGSQGVDEAGGNIPSVKDSYTDGDIANMSIGQGGIMATPVQVADMIATVANGGIKNQVNIIDSIIDADGKEVRKVRRSGWNRVISKNTAQKLSEMMAATVEHGTGTKAKPEENFIACGKTGSAETGVYINGEKVVHGWFAGYFPGNNPKYSVAVFVENGKSGGQAAGPIFKEIAEGIFRSQSIPN
ncbi:peptidoglycan D,D-transpeptidase FtsI family protein [Pseudobacteroides cellulosolvens]|uniref:Penicillin-binding protein transpeptidase n=1 Tax=Pseudobacteroides cellulosolvens ATCC 35603 = DSM 2933 TaxID=398512 RepID=A0A0L6JGP1_9FIRM|nr:penicillin-binding transpeptidase domain-containing protein [Pseudobacteroides cellulosolvens]KNY24879.1 penicillin-binding protein transpeptidase [Pseudobacteroides cellulosolvens ATCC 35603 = DSM 2933]